MGKTSQKQKEKRLAGRVSLALAAGMFSVVPVAHGMPTLDQVKDGGATVHPVIDDTANSGYKIQNITSGADKNVIHWKDFSVAEKEHVHFDAHDYMNVVTGKTTSAIDGIMDGGKNVYLINPNGVIFGAKAQVNVGNLYVSTRNDSNVLEQRFLAEHEDSNGVMVPTYTGSAVLPALANNALKADVVSLIDKNGYVAATEVVMEGKNIRFLNANQLAAQDAVRVIHNELPTVDTVADANNETVNVTVTSEALPSSMTGNATSGFTVNTHIAAENVKFRANTFVTGDTNRNTDDYGTGYIHVGNGKNIGTGKSYANADGAENAVNYTAQYLNQTGRIANASTNGEDFGVVNYSLIRSLGNLQSIGTNSSALSQNYMLAKDIDALSTFASIGQAKGVIGQYDSITGGKPFTGHFDGMFHTVENLSTSGTTLYSGLFSYANGATIENVGVVNATFLTNFGGGVVGYADNTILRNVWNEGGTIGSSYANNNKGGIVGFAKGKTQLTNVYNTGSVYGGGLAGSLRENSGIRNAYNIGKLFANTDGEFSGIVSSSSAGSGQSIKIDNVYTASNYAGMITKRELASANTFANTTQTNVQIISIANDITDWIMNANNSNIGKTTVSSEGGTTDTWRVYEGYSKSLPLLNSFMKAKGTVSTEYTYGDTQVDTFNYNSANVPHKTYDAKTVLGDTPVYSYLGANVAQDTGLIKQNNRKNVYTDLNGNAAKFALFYSEQQGYDLYGNNFKIEQRNISYDGSGTKNFTKEYDGTTDGTNALKALFSASSTSSDQGFLDADAANVKFVLGSGVSATYNDEDVLEATSFTISGTEASGAIKLEAAQGAENPDAYKNYKVGTVTNLDGTYTNDQNATVQITPRSIKVSLKENGGITKTYDGTATVTDQNKGETDGFLPNENVVIESGRVLDRDNGVAVTYNANARYVDVGTNGLTSAVNAGDHKVAYEGISLTGGDATKRANYKLVDSSNAALTAGYILADGTIAKRKITADDLTSPTGGGPTKTYDGTSTGTASTTVGVDESMLVDKAGGTRTHDNTTTGLLYSDKDLVKLTTTGDVTFGYEDAQGGFHASADATTSEYATAANKARYTVALDTANSDATAVANYEIDANTQVTGNGTINKRNISAALNVPDGGIVKTYDGTATVSSPEWKYVYSAAATTDEKKALEEIVGSDATIGITAAYKAGNGFGAKDVAYTDANSDVVTTKDIQYTLTITGTKAANYNLTAAAVDEDSDNNVLTGTIANAGKINPAELGLTITPVSKRYDTTSDVNTTAAPNTVAEAITATTQNNEAFNEAAITGLYGVVNTTGTFTADPNVAYNGEDVAEKDVQYSGFHAALGENYKNYTIQGKKWKTSNTAYGKGTIYKAKIGAAELAQKTNIVNPQPTLTKTYDGSTNYDISGLAASDFLTVNYAGLAIPNDSLDYTIADAVYTGDGAKNVGTNKDMTMTFTFQTNGLGNFELTSDGTDTVDSLNVAKTGFKGNITAQEVTATLTNQPTLSKTYDGTTALKKADGTTYQASDIKGWFTLTGIVDGETATVGLDTATLKGAYADQNASDTNKTVNYSGLALASTSNDNPVSNYTLVLKQNNQTVNQITGVGTISKRTVQLSDYGNVERQYVQGNANVTTDDIAIKAGTADDWEVLKLDHIVDNDTTDGLITADGITGVYLKTGNESLAEDVRRKSATDRSVEKKDVQYSGIYNVFDSTNYIVKDKSGNMIANDATAKGTWKAAEGGKITPIALEITSIIAADATKTYDGTRDFKIDGNPNAKAIDQLTFTASDGDLAKQVLTVKEAKYDSKDVNTVQHVDYTLKLSGDVNNYDLTGTVGAAIEQDGNHEQTIQGVGTITPATIYAFGYTGDGLTNDQKAQVTKVYDRTDSAPVITGTDGRLLWVKTNLDSEGEGLAKYGTDDVSVVAAAIAYADKNAATSDTKMKYSGILLSGEDAGNYTLSNATAYGYGSITPKVLEFNTVNDKYYDANTAATENGVNPSDVNVVTAAVDAWQTAGDILSYTDAQGTHYDDVTISGLVGEYGTWNPSINGQSGTWTPSADVKRASATDRTVQQRDVLYTNITLGGADAGNYVVKSSTKNITRGNTTLQETVYFTDAIQKGTIRPIALTYSANQQNSDVTETWTVANKVYDGTASVVGFDTNGNPITANNLTINYSKNGMTGTLDYNVVSAVYKSTTQGEADADAGTGKTVAYKVELAPLTLNNYDLDSSVTNRYASTNEITSTAGGNIARRLLVVDADNTALVAPAAGKAADNTKIYDGSSALFAGSKTYEDAQMKAASGNLQNASGLLVGDQVSVTYTANFNDAAGKNADIDPDTVKPVNGDWTRDVTYTFTLGNTEENTTAGNDVAKNYTLVQGGSATSATDTRKGAIRRREVQVAFKNGVDSTNFDKTYDESGAIVDGTGNLLTDGLTNRTLDDAAATGILTLTGVVDGEDVHLDTAAANQPTAEYYVNGTKNTNGDTNYKLGVTTQDVYVQNLNLAGNDSGNYKLTTTKLTGKGDIRRKQVTAELRDGNVTKEYDGTNSVAAPFLATNIKATGVVDGTTASDNVEIDNDKLQLGFVEPVIYYDKNNPTATYNGDAREAGGLGVKYYLKVDNKNYELIRQRLDDDANGKITKRVLTENAGDDLRIEKTYDGTTALGDASSVTTGLFGNVLDKDKTTLLTVTGGNYTNPNTGAAADSVQGAAQQVTVNYQLTEAGHKNYKLDAGDTTDAGTYSGNRGYINRAALTLAPTPVTYNTGDAIPTDGYAGSVSGFKGNDALADGYNVTFERDNNRSTAAGNYTLLGYVNGQLPTAANGLMYYNNLGDGATGNYYFVQQPNNALQINAKADVMDEVNQSTIADKKFTPDDYSYNRMSKDPDLTRMNRESSATVQYSEKGVNIDGDDTKSGLSALADIKGAGSVVNLEGAFIRTSAPAEQPETVAAEAALPVPETEESDISSISLEYAGDGDNSQALLEILTNASSNAEKKGTSIVIDAQDEDEEDAEEEKSRRAIFADRSNIGIETLGDAVNLNQMIG